LKTNLFYLFKGNEKVQLIFVDNGQITEINLNLLKPLNKLFCAHPAQALACSLTHVRTSFFFFLFLRIVI